MKFDTLLTYKPFSVPDKIKQPLLMGALKEEFEYHYQMCAQYRKYCQKQRFTPPLNNFSYQNLPYLPVSIFKEIVLNSLPQRNFQIIHSSATSSQKPSSVALDQTTKTRQIKSLSWLLSDLLGNKRLPFIIFDAKESPIIADEYLSARNAAIRGFLIAALSYAYAMKGSPMQLDLMQLERSISELNGQELVLFGYTYVIYHQVLKKLQEKGKKFSLPNAKLIHIGGWKKLQNESITKDAFNLTVNKVFGLPINNIIDAYGFTEQLGLIYFDYGNESKRCPIIAEVLIRDPISLKPVNDGELGLIELITPLPHSYPGIAILTDDLGRIISREKSEKNRYGTAFEVIGRAKETDMRGCGDILAEISNY